MNEMIKAVRREKRRAEQESRVAFRELRRCVAEDVGKSEFFEVLRNDTKALRAKIEAGERLRRAEETGDGD